MCFVFKRLLVALLWPRHIGSKRLSIICINSNRAHSHRILALLTGYVLSSFLADDYWLTVCCQSVFDVSIYSHFTPSRTPRHFF